MNKDKILKFLLLALAFSVPFFGRSPNISKYLAIILVMTWLFRGKVSLKNPIALPVFFYLAVTILSGIVGLNPQNSMRYFLKHSINIILVLIIADCIKDHKTFKLVIKVFLISAGFVCFLGILQYFSTRLSFLTKPLSLIGIQRMFGGRIYSTRGHPLVFADNIALYLPVMAAFAVYNRKVLSVIGTIVAATALILTYSRTPAAAVLFVFILAVILFFKRLKILVIPVFASLFAAFLIIAVFKGMPVKQRMNLNLGGRVAGWKAALNMTKKYPLFGVGSGNVSMYYKKTDEWRKAKLSHMHNTYVQIAVATGMFGFITFIWIIYAFFRECIKRIKSIHIEEEEKFVLIGITFGFIATFLAGMTDDLFCRSEIYYPIYFLAGLAMSRPLGRQ